MTSGLGLLLAIAVAYLAAHVAYDWLARRLVLVSGAEYLVLGILLGPQVSGLFSADTVAGFAPIITLALGWIGAIIGMQFYLPHLINIGRLQYRLAFGEAAITLAVVTAVELYALRWTAELPPRQALASALALGAIACASTPAAIDVAARAMGSRGRIVEQLELTTGIDALLAIGAFGFFLAFYHPHLEGVGRAPTATEWMVITLAIGVVAGSLFHLFLGDEERTDRLVISLAGAIILASGTAAYLGLSPLLAAMVVGIVLVNTSGSRTEIWRVLARGERPLYFVLLIFAGATWRPASTLGIVPIVAFLVARTVAKVGGARLVTRLNGALPLLGPDWGRALLGQGGLAIALGLDYIVRDSSPVPNTIFTAALVSVLLTDLSSARLVRGVLGNLLEPERRPRRTSGARAAQPDADARGSVAPPTEAPEPPAPTAARED